MPGRAPARGSWEPVQVSEHRVMWPETWAGKNSTIQLLLAGQMEVGRRTQVHLFRGYCNKEFWGEAVRDACQGQRVAMGWKGRM